MSRVSQLLREEAVVFTIGLGDTILKAAQTLRAHNIGALPVMAGDRLVGIISERDLTFRVLAEGIDPEETVDKYMTINPEFVSPFTDVMDCLNLMKEVEARHVPVLEKGKLVGIVSMRDVLYALLKNQELLAQQFESYILGAR